MASKGKAPRARTEPKIATAQEWGSSGIEDFHREAIEKGLAIPLHLPSGKTVLATRPPLMEWMVFGMVPEALTSAALNASEHKLSQAEITKTIEKTLTDPGELRRMATFTRDVVQWAIVRPRIKQDATGPNEILPSMVPKGDLMFILDWIKKGCPGVPVLTEKGAVSVEALNTFRDGNGRPATSRSRRRRKVVR